MRGWYGAPCTGEPLDLIRPLRDRSKPHARAALKGMLRRGSLSVRLAVLVSTTGMTGFLPRAGWLGGLVGTLLAGALTGLEQWMLLVVWGVLGYVAVRSLGPLGDASEINVDEAVGAYMAAALSGARGAELALTFVLFAILDFLKPFPANRLDLREDALGIMGDDAVAGLVAGLFAAGVFALTRS